MEFINCNLEANGAHLHYVKAGAGPLMLFLHGFPELWYAWREQLDEFSKDHLAVAPDLRGYNLSSKPDEVSDYGIAHLMEDVRALAAHLGYQKFVLVGHDWGGFIAWSFAMQYPEMLERLVILNAPHPAIFGKLLREDTEQQKASQYITAFRNPGAEDWLAADNFAALKRVMNAQLSDAEMKEYENAWSQPGALQAMLNYYRAMKPASAAADYRVRVPTLVLWGEQDHALVAKNIEGLEAFVPLLKIQRFPSASHWLVHEESAEINRAIRNFLL